MAFIKLMVLMVSLVLLVKFSLVIGVGINIRTDNSVYFNIASVSSSVTSASVVTNAITVVFELLILLPVGIFTILIILSNI